MPSDLVTLLEKKNLFESSLRRGSEEGTQFESGLDSGLNPVLEGLALCCRVLLKTLVSCLKEIAGVVPQSGDSTSVAVDETHGEEGATAAHELNPEAKESSQVC